MAVALSILKALVKALDKLHMVLATNSGYSGSNVKPVDVYLYLTRCPAVVGIKIMRHPELEYDQSLAARTRFQEGS